MPLADPAPDRHADRPAPHRDVSGKLPDWVGAVNVAEIVQKLGLEPDDADRLADLVAGARLDPLLEAVRRRWAEADEEEAHLIEDALRLIGRMP